MSMSLKRVSEATIEEVRSSCDTIIAACGYEERSSAIVRVLNGAIRNRIAFEFKENPGLYSRRANEKRFQKGGFKMIPAAGYSAEAVRATAKDLFRSDIPISLAIDVSSMTRVWQGEFIRQLLLSNAPRVTTYFTYVRAKFSQPPSHFSFNETVAPIPGFASLAPPTLPLALVIGLGYEPERALGLQELLDPRRTVLMIPRVEVRDPFAKAVRKSNEDILCRVASESIFEYPLIRPSATFHLLESLCTGLTRNYRVVLASLGPKLFSVCTFLVAARNSAISVWRVSQGGSGIPRNSVADMDYVAVMKAEWEQTRQDGDALTEVGYDDLKNA